MSAFTIEKGTAGERIARDYMEAKGLQFLHANWRCKTGEVDLIFQDSDSTRIFIEVRTRTKTTFGDGAETVFRQKQQKLIRTAKYYQQKERYWGDIRFDVISILLVDGQEPAITHIPDAFIEG